MLRSKNDERSTHVFQIQKSLDSYDYEMAQKYCQKALEMDNENIKVLEITGQVMMDVGDMEAAKQVRFMM